MNWKNEEQYPDQTAAEAMIRAMDTNRRNTDALDDEGCRLLMEAIVRQAVEDRLRALRRQDRAGLKRLRETESFFRSEYFRRLTGLDGRKILQLIRKEAEEE